MKDSFLTNKLPVGSKFIVDFTIANEEVLRSIPEEYFNKARKHLYVACKHASYCTHVSYVFFGLQDYKPGDEILFGIPDDNPGNGKLDFRDYALGRYAEPGKYASAFHEMKQHSFWPQEIFWTIRIMPL